MRIGIAGIDGRMGVRVVEAVASSGASLSGGTGRQTGRPLGELADASDVIVDFTHPDATVRHAAVLGEHRAAWVLGTTGLGREAESAVRLAAERIPVVWAANFSPGVTLMLHLARGLARALPAALYDAEIVEMHHRHKRDAPSGTALALGQAVACGRGMPLEVAVAQRGGNQAGPREAGAVGYASLRGGEVVGEHTLLFAGADEHISISHKALDRRIFAAGAVRAALWTRGRAPGLYTMADVLGLIDQQGWTPR